MVKSAAPFSKEKKERGITYNELRKINILKSLELCKKNCPMDFEKIVSFIEFETGLTPEKAKAYLKVLYDIGKINIENNTVTIIEGKK